MRSGGRAGRLGGWTRLWIVLTVMYGVVVALVAYSMRPSLEPLQRLWVSDAKLAIREVVANHTLESLIASPNLTPEERKALIPLWNALEASDRDDLSGRLDMSFSDADAQLRDREPADAVAWLERLAEHPTDKEAPLAPVVAEVNAKHRQTVARLPARQLRHALLAVAAWIGPSLALYGLGWSVGWVAGGFRQKAE